MHFSASISQLIFSFFFFLFFNFGENFFSKDRFSHWTRERKEHFLFELPWEFLCFPIPSGPDGKSIILYSPAAQPFVELKTCGQSYRRQWKYPLSLIVSAEFRSRNKTREAQSDVVIIYCTYTASAQKSWHGWQQSITLKSTKIEVRGRLKRSWH